ncbi:SDR family oxidoreductase [Citrifermentans bremense]|uniref:SDR family oxidoreductase n=1 Tax=Citrifermentans bremense TaxID=60035 RepID=UPI000426F667|nr:SDR family oxidoreductase [Citrifermentans bremense]
MDIAGKTVLVTGANGGIGRALVEGLLKKGASKVYAAARTIEAVAELSKIDKRVTAVRLEVTHATSVAAAAEHCPEVDLVINNAGINRCAGFMAENAMENARQEIKVNYLGTLAMCRAFAPALIERKGCIVNVCSVIGLVNLPVNGTYSASKAAGHSLLQGIRAELAPQGVKVLGIYPGPVDTRMTSGQEMPKATTEEVVQAILEGIEKEQEEIYPDAMSKEVSAALLQAPKEVERQFSAMIPA